MDSKDIKGIRLIGTQKRTSNSYGRNLPYVGYRVMVILDDKASPQGVMRDIAQLFSDEKLKELSYWSKRSNTMAMTCWGTSRLFEAQIALGRWLGFDSKDWPEFSQRVTSFITEI